MKKIAIFGLVFILLAVSVVPVMAGNGSSNGHGNGVGNGQGNGGGNKDKEKGQEKSQDKERNTEHGFGKFKNQENDKWKYTPFYLQGTITAVDTGAKTITVQVIHANAKVKSFIGKTIVIKANEGTLFYKVTQGEGSEENSEGDKGGKVVIKFADLAVGQRVAIHGRLTGEDYVARLITVYEGTPIGQPVEAKP